MNKDIRLLLDFKTHRKRKKLQNKLGAEGVLSLINLWLSVAEQRPDGILTGYDESDIEIDADWEGKPGEFVSELLEIGFLIKEDSVFKIYGWQEKQEWVCDSINRSGKARFSKLASMDKELFEKLKAKGVNSITVEEYKDLTKKQRPVNVSLSNVNDSLCKNGELIEKPNDSPTTPCRNANGLSAGRSRNANGSLTPTPTPTPSPSPSPSPTHNVLKKTPAASEKKSDVEKKIKPDITPSGISFKNFKKDKSVVNKHSVEDLGKCFQGINKACGHILTLPAKKKKFSPHKWAQVSINARSHPGAVQETLEGLNVFWDTADDPWGMCNSILKTKNGNWNEKDAIKIHEELKSMKPGQLEFFTQGLFQEITS